MGSLAGIARNSWGTSLWNICGAGASGFGANLCVPELEEGLDAVAVAGRDAGRDCAGREGAARDIGCGACFATCSVGLSSTGRGSLLVPWAALTMLTGELACTVARTEHLSRVIPRDTSILGSSSGITASSSMISSGPALMKPESLSRDIVGKTGLDLLGNRLSKTGGDDGMLKDGSKRPW